MIKFPDELTIALVDECKTAFLAQIDKEAAIELDDSDLQRIDTIGVQFIIAVVTYIHAQGKELKWTSKSTILKDSLSQLGVNDEIVMQYIASD